MKPAVALLASACLALAGSVAVRAELLQQGNSRAQVNDAAVLHGLPQNLSDFGFLADPFSMRAPPRFELPPC